MAKDIFSDAEVFKARQETPGVNEVIHFNNAGAGLMSQPVLDAVIAHLQLEARVGGYEAVEEKQADVKGVYDSAARLIGALPDEIAVVENATRAWDMAFYSIPFQRGDKILAAKSSYASNYIALLQTAQQKGVTIEVIPDDECGQVSVAALENMLDSRVKLVEITHVPTNGGLVNPAVEVGKVTRPAGVYYLLDACQSIGQMPVDVNEIGCDILSATSRKFLRGPRGMGFLYVRKERIAELIPPILDIHAATWVARDRYEIRPDAQRFENWECNYAAKIGMGKAIDYALTWGLDKIWERVQSLADTLRRRLEETQGITVCDKGQVRCGIVTFKVENIAAGRIRTEMHQRKINVTTSSMFATRLDMEDRGIDVLVRASVHYYNTIEEIDRFCDVLAEMID